MFRKFILVFFLFCFSAFQFPEEHSFHPDHSLEWCYFVGHLRTETGEVFGYELSFFRLSQEDKKTTSKIEVFPVHFAISHPLSQTHLTSQTIQRKMAGLAGFEKSRIWSGEYELKILSANEFHITAFPKFKDFSLDLHLKGKGQTLLHGENGLSRKSRKNQNLFSYYYSYPRLESSGKIVFGGKEHSVVSGLSWMDHEWSEKGNTNDSLVSQGTGWDWISLHGEEGDDFVFFSFKEKSNSDPESFGTFRNAKSRIISYRKEKEVKMIPKKEQWKSPSSGIEYPLHWRIEFPEGYWNVEPIFSEQEFDGRKSTGIVYWEGMVKAEGEVLGKKSTAKGYLELKGYSPKKKWWEL